MFDLCPTPLCAPAASPHAHVAPQRVGVAQRRLLAPVMLSMPQLTPETGDPEQNPASRVRGLIAGGASLYNTAGSKDALAALIASQKSSTPGTDTFGPAGQGTWEVGSESVDRLNATLSPRPVGPAPSLSLPLTPGPATFLACRCTTHHT